MDWSSLGNYFRILILSTYNTIFLGVAAIVLSTLLAVPLAFISISSLRIVRLAVTLYSWAARSTPVMIILFFAYFGLGQIGIRLDPMPAAILGFMVFCTAYNLEIIRGGFQGVGRVQFDAARALGLSYPRMMQRIILPQVVRIIAPPYLTNAVQIMKSTSIASVIAVREVTLTANLLVVSTRRPFEILAMSAVIYIVLNSMLIVLQAVIEKRSRFQI